jgi:opacity protein-like surface antigen
VTARAGRPLVLLVLVGLLAWVSAASAEPYLAGYAGAAFTETKDLDTQLELNGFRFIDGRLRDLDFETSVLVGGKLGYYFDRPVLGGHVGLEVEGYHFEADVRPQTVRFQGILAGVPADTNVRVQRADIDVVGAGLNLLYRVPVAVSDAAPRGRVQPYVGVGLAVLIAELSTRTTPFDVNKKISDTDVQPAIQALAGVRVFVTRNLAVFLEYKYLHSEPFSFHFREPGTITGAPFVETARDRSELRAHHLALGVGFHW